MYVPTVNQKLTLKGLPFQSMLRKKLYDKALEFLKSQTPSGVHLALEQVGPMASGDEEELKEGQGRPLEASSTYMKLYSVARAFVIQPNFQPSKNFIAPSFVFSSSLISTTIASVQVPNTQATPIHKQQRLTVEMR